MDLNRGPKGGDSDAAFGLRAVKEHGSIALVQHPAGAMVSGMPRSAMAADHPDASAGRSWALPRCRGWIGLVQAREIDRPLTRSLGIEHGPRRSGSLGLGMRPMDSPIVPESEDPAVAAFSALQGEVAEVVTAIGGLQAQLTALRGGLDELRRREAPTAPDYNHRSGFWLRR